MPSEELAMIFFVFFPRDDQVVGGGRWGKWMLSRSIIKPLFTSLNQLHQNHQPSAKCVRNIKIIKHTLATDLFPSNSIDN